MPAPSLMGMSTESLSSTMMMMPPSKHRTAIILDWDDTLLCSTWLALNDLRLDNASYSLTQAHRDELAELERRVIRFLERAISLASKVFLVTNAETGWVELSCERFLPGIAALLPQLKVVSARSKHESKFPNLPSQWKVQAFREEIGEFIQNLSSYEMMMDVEDDNGVANIISIGDSHHEREALHTVTSEFDNMLVKSVKFVERPDMDVLRRQIELIYGCIEYICLHDQDLDLMLSHSLLMSSSSSSAAAAASGPAGWIPSGTDTVGTSSLSSPMIGDAVGVTEQQAEQIVAADGL